METSGCSISVNSFTTFGELLKYLRRREKLTQLELSIAVGYSEAQISRLEKNLRLPELTTIQALFIPALHLQDEPQLQTRFIELAQTARQVEAPTPGVSPYKGLLYYDDTDAELFFGREAITARLTKHILDLDQNSPTRFLAVVGASGSGKSSILRAGLVVALRRAGWDAYAFTPTTDPLKMLAKNLKLARTKNADRVLILVDQFEEAFTQCHNAVDRIAFFENLLSCAQDETKKYFVVIALRSDFYTHCAQYPLLRQAVSKEQEYIGGMTPLELRRAIEEPAAQNGWEFEPGLVELLLEDVGAYRASEPEPGALPLLSHALLANWEHRVGRRFTLSGYHTCGGVRGSIAQTAESVFNDQLNQDQQELAKHIFLRLTELGEQTQATRRRASLVELVRQPDEATQLRTVLNILADARLIILSEDSAEVAHEALISEWKRLQDWLSQDRQGLLLHRHLTNAAHEWETSNREPSELYRGARLAQIQEWASAHLQQLNPLEEAFLAASVEQEQFTAQEREAQRQRELETAQRLAKVERTRVEEQILSVKKLRKRGVFLVSALLLTILAAIAAGVFANISRQQAMISYIREVSNAANQNLEIDPERSILLALQAVNKTYLHDQTVLPEAEEALHRAVQASRVELTLRGHQGAVSNAVFSPDGSLVATSSTDGTARIWDAISGTELLSVEGTSYGPGSPFGYVWFTSFSPDGKYLATAGGDGMVRVWEVKTGKIVLTIRDQKPVVHVEYSRDGKRLITASQVGGVKVWDVLTGKRLLTIKPGVGFYPTWVSFSPDGTWIAVASNLEPDWGGFHEGWVGIWDAFTGKMILSLPHLDARVVSVAFSPDGSRIITNNSDQTVRIWRANDGKELMILDGSIMRNSGTPYNSVYSPDGTRIATIVLGNRVKVWDAQTGRELITLVGHCLDITTVAFSPDGNRLVSASMDGTARIWNLAPSRELLTLVNDTVNPPFVGSQLAYSPNGDYLAFTNFDITPKIWDLATGKPYLKLTGHTGSVTSIAYSADGRSIFTSARDGSAKVWDSASGTEQRTLSVPYTSVINAAFSPDGSRLALIDYSGRSAILWDTDKNQLIHSLSGNTGPAYSLAFNPDGTRLVSSGVFGALVWDVITGRQLFFLTGHFDEISQVVFSPDGKYLATASADGSAKVWDGSSGKEILTLSGHTSNLLSVAFSLDGKNIATASGDRTVKLWNAFTGEELFSLYSPAVVTSLAFSPDGTQLATAGMDGAARIYLLKIEDLIALAMQRVTRSLTTEECQRYLHLEACPEQP